MEVGYLLKCILVVLVFLVKILVMYFHVPKNQWWKKDMCLQRKMYAAGKRPRVRRTATASEKWPGHDPIALPKRTESGQNGGPFGVVRWSWPYKWDRSWGNRLSANPHLARRAMAELEKRRGWRDCCSTDSNKYGVRWKSCWWRVPYSWTWMLVLAHATLLLLLLIVVVSRIRGAGYVQRTH